jgi:hypothetical protein
MGQTDDYKAPAAAAKLNGVSAEPAAGANCKPAAGAPLRVVPATYYLTTSEEWPIAD